MAVKYEFDKIIYKFAESYSKGNYIFQYITDRRLTDIYHSHDFYEWIIIMNGECTKNINGDIYKLKKNNVVLLKPDDYHSFIGQSEDVRLLCLSVRCDEFEKFCYIYNLRSDDIKENRFFKNDRICETVLSLFPEPESISKEQDLKLLFSFLIKICVDNLDLRGGNMPEWLVLTLKEMEKTQNIKEGIPAMIEISNYSRSRLSRLIKKYLGISLHEYISGLRLVTAHKDIVLTDKSLEEIGESVGYSSFSHFQKIFKEKYGITPARLRNKYRSWTV